MSAAMIRGGRAKPKLAELIAELRARGVDDPAPAVLDAIATGADRFAMVIATDDLAWQRFREGFDALLSGQGEVSSDATTVGAIAWTYLLGRNFTDAVAHYARGSAPTLH